MKWEGDKRRNRSESLECRERLSECDSVSMEIGRASGGARERSPEWEGRGEAQSGAARARSGKRECECGSEEGAGREGEIVEKFMAVCRRH